MDEIQDGKTEPTPAAVLIFFFFSFFNSPLTRGGG